MTAASWRGRARSLSDLLDAQADKSRGADPRLLERERELEKQIGLKASRERQLPNGSDESNALAREIEQLRIELLELQTEIARGGARGAAANDAARADPPAPFTAKEIQTRLLDPDTLVVEYSLGDERSYAWALTSGEVMSFALPKRGEIEEAARRVRETLSARSEAVRAGESTERRGARIVAAGRQYPEAAAELSRMVLAPFAGMLAGKRLVVVADGALQYVPFAALPLAAPGQPAKDDAPPLITEHEVVVLPSLGVLSVLERAEAARTRAPLNVAVFADPVFEKSDARVKQSPADGKTEADAPAGAPRLREAFERGASG